MARLFTGGGGYVVYFCHHRPAGDEEGARCFDRHADALAFAAEVRGYRGRWAVRVYEVGRPVPLPAGEPAQLAGA